MIIFKVPREHIWDFFKQYEDELQYEDALIASGKNSEIGITISNFWKRPAFYVTNGRMTKEIIPFTQDDAMEIFDTILEKYLSDDLEAEKSSEELRATLVDATNRFINDIISENMYGQTIDDVSSETIKEILESAEETLFNNDGIIIHNPVITQDEYGVYKESYSIFENAEYCEDYEVFGS